jgi:nitrous oxidase accessory protein
MLALLLGLASVVGAANVPCPAGVDVARNAVALRAQLAGSARDVWVAGRVVGDFEAARAVALHGCEGALLSGTGTGTVLRVRGDDVLIENLTLQHSGDRVSAEDGALKVSGKRAQVRHVTVRDSLYGIALEQCRDCLVEAADVAGRAEIVENQRGDAIKLWEAHGSIVRDSYVHGARDVVVWYSRNVTLENNRIVDGRYGTHFMYAHDALVRGSVLRGNTVGIFVMYSARVRVIDNELSGARGPAGMGIGFKESDAVHLSGNALVANSVATYLDHTPRNPELPVLFEGNSFALNRIALRFHGSERGASFQRNDFFDNDVLIEVDGNADARQVVFTQNYWASYAGYDLDRDGYGDVPFQVKLASSSLAGTSPLLRFFHGTAAMGLYDALALALPYFGSRLVLEDGRPAVTRHRELR